MLISGLPSWFRRLRLSRVVPLLLVAVCLVFFLKEDTAEIFRRSSLNTQVPLQCVADGNTGQEVKDSKEVNKTIRTAVLDEVLDTKSEDTKILNAIEKNPVRDPQDFPFRFLLNEPGFCAGGVDILNFIFVSPGDKHTRSHIRSQWGNATYFPYTGMRTLFMIARAESEATQKFLERESDAYHDILQCDFLDSYENLTLKTLSMLYWTKTYCPDAKWVFKSDTDVFVNSFAIAKYLKHTSGDFVCSVCQNCTVCRRGMDCLEKWWVSEEEYPYKYYPHYCHGSAYIIRTDTAKKIYDQANKTHPLVIEDAYFTGVLTRALNVTYIDLNRKLFIRFTSKLPQDFVRGSSLMVLHIDTFSRRSPKLWKKIVRYNTGSN